MKDIEVSCDPKACPEAFAHWPEFWMGQDCRKAGIPLFERSLSEGPRRGTLTRLTLEGGIQLFSWTLEESAGLGGRGEAA